MQLTDTLSGTLAAIGGMAVVWSASTFPPMPGQGFGPAVFPAVAGVGLIGLGLALLASGIVHREGFSIRFDDWVRRPRMVLNGALVPGMLAFYALTVDTVGFFLASAAVLVVLFLAFGVRRTWILPLAAGVTLVLHYGFYTLLRVPLPWGVFESLAW
jgi:putative tricarboxylic transport membrane protein